MDSKTKSASRPYWHVDLKWVSGLLLVPALASTMLVYGLVQITEEKPATDLMALGMALMFSRNGLDDDTDIQEMRRVLSANPAGVQPIPGLRLTIQSSDFQGSSAREIRLNFFRQMVRPIYQEGPAGLAKLADDPKMKQQILEGAGPLGMLGLQTHQTLERVFTALALISAIMFIPLIVFSSRFGRVGSPGVALFVASVPGSIVAAALTRPGAAGNAEPPTGADNLMGIAGYVIAQSIPTWGKIASAIYFPALEAGLALIALALISNIVWKLWPRRSAADVPTDAVSGLRPGS